MALDQRSTRQVGIADRTVIHRTRSLRGTRGANVKAEQQAGTRRNRRPVA